MTLVTSCRLLIANISMEVVMAKKAKKAKKRAKKK
jgi:hypothetical protein